MSFKLFTLQAFGKLKSTEKIESERNALLIDYAEFLNVEGSEELKEYITLESLVNSEAFKNRKKDIQDLQFKGSHEQKDLLEFQKLAKSKKIKLYLQTSTSSELKRFETLKDSDIVKEYYVLKYYMEDGEFQKDKREVNSKIFKGSPQEGHLKEFKALKKNKGLKAYFKLNESAQLEEHDGFLKSEKLATYLDLKNATDRDKEGRRKFKKLRRDLRIIRYFRFERSSALRLYRESIDSHQLKRWFKLETLINSDAFKKEKAPGKTQFERVKGNSTGSPSHRKSIVCQENSGWERVGEWCQE